MPTNTTVKQLKINKLTEAQYDAAVQGGTIGANELSFVTDMNPIPCVVQDFSVDSSTGAITCTFNVTPTTKTVHTIIGGTAIAGSWSGNVFTPSDPADILSNANGFIVSVA